MRSAAVYGSLLDKNLFHIARKANVGDENQLTEMFAWLLQEQPDLIAELLGEAGVPPSSPEVVELPADDSAARDASSGAIDAPSPTWQVRTQVWIEDGFLDLQLTSPGQLVIIESKLGSVTSYEQITKYLRHARKEPAKQRVLILLTREDEAFPVGVDTEAAGEVELVRMRWWDVAEVARRSGGRLGCQFADMLEWEGIVKPAAFSVDDWEMMNAGASIVRRVGKLLGEAREAIAALEPPAVGVVNQPVYSGGGYVYVQARYRSYAAALGIWASASAPEHGDGDVHIIAYVLNTVAPEKERPSQARQFVKAIKAGEVTLTPLPESQDIRMSGWSEGHVQRSAPVATVIDPGATFAVQMAQSVEFLRDTVELFRAAGYLAPRDLARTRP